ncbi:MAG: HAD family hydrolase [Crocinitomicaceae bacterium]|jgi:HAD superfamily hydrolase (TIGR01549 family)|nr:HAD family hydrolase [Crocinitomicaceae bacterium]
MRLKNIFFDFDGVIKDSTRVKSDAFYALYEPFGKEIAMKVVEHHQLHGGVSRFEKFKLYHQEHLGVSLNEKEIQEWAHKFSELVLEKVISADYIEGAPGIFKELKRQNINCFIITGTPQNEIEFILKELGIYDYFKAIGGSPIKKKEWCDTFLSGFKLSANETLFIGDATTDYEAAQYAKTHFLLIENEENSIHFKNIDCKKSPNLTNLLSYLV